MQKELKCFGLTQMEKEYLVAIRTNNSTKISRKMVDEIDQSSNQQNSKNWIKQTITSIQNCWKEQKPKFQQIFQNIENLFKSLSANKSLSVQNLSSKIVCSSQQIKTLFSFFPPKNVKNINLLYRASQNQFSCKKFWEKCSNIPNTLILVQTELDKKIGGYTPISWKKGIKSQTNSDVSKESFIFSITNADKFNQVDQNIATYYHNQNYGPIFGTWKGCDLALTDKADQNNRSTANIVSCYLNENYKKDDKESNKKFTGSQQIYFKIKEWEVFQIIFV